MRDEELQDLCTEVFSRFPSWNFSEKFSCNVVHPSADMYHPGGHAPIYTSDYILDKLPIIVESEWSHSGDNELTIVKLDGKYSASYLHSKEDRVALVGSTNFIGASNTPLKALLKLVIALDDAGVEL